MMTPHEAETREPLSPRARIAWRRAADELLIDAIFGAGYEPFPATEPAVTQASMPTQPQQAPTVP